MVALKIDTAVKIQKIRRVVLIIKLRRSTWTKQLKYVYESFFVSLWGCIEISNLERWESYNVMEFYVPGKTG